MAIMTTTASDVAAFILKQSGPMSAWKLQKLVYYAQAWSLVWDKAPLFAEPIQAWRHGPVVPSLYAAHHGAFTVSAVPGGDPSKLAPSQRDTTVAVVDFYGRHDGEWLAEVTHREAPWRDARGGMAAESKSNAIITTAAMEAFYSQISTGNSKIIPEALERGYELLMSLSEDEQHLLDEDEDYDPDELNQWVNGAGPGSAD